MSDLVVPAWAPAQSNPLAVTVYNQTGGLLTEAEVESIAWSIVTKDIWGPTFRAFMGMSDTGTGLDEINDDPASWGRARVAEPYIFRALDVRAKAIASVPLKCWRVDRNGRKTATPHIAIDVLNRTNAFTAYVNGLGTLMRYTLGSLDTHGRCAWQLAFSNPDSSGRRIPTEITWLVPQAFTPVHGYEMRMPVPFAGIKYMTGGQSQFISADKIVYFSTDNIQDPIIGTSKVSVLKNTINLRLYSVKSNYDFFKNSMRPDWILSGEWKNTPENIESIRRALARHFTGESNRSPLVIGEGTKASLLTTTQKDAEWVQMMRMVGEEIMAVFGVPVIFLNNFERATYENAKQARLMLWHETMIQETRDLAAQMTSKYLWNWWPESRGQSLELGFDYNAVEGLTEDVGLLWERVKNYQDVLTKFIEKRLMTPNQGRVVLAQITEAMGLDSSPFKGQLPDGQGDVVFIPWDQIPADQASVQEMMNIQAARSANPLTGFLIENVPGAPNAGTNAQAGIAEQQRQQQQTLQAQQQAARSTAQQQQRAWHPTIVKATPHPGPIRDNRLAPIQKRATAKLKRWFQDLQRESLRTLRANVKAVSPTGDLYDRTAAKDGVRVIIRTAVSESGSAAYAASSEDFGLTVQWSDDNPWLAAHMGKRIALIDGIDDTTAEALSQTLTEGAQAGETVDQLADRVSAVFANAIDGRAETIARTETIQAYGSASIQSYREAGIDQVQMYDGSDDPECAAVDGMVVSPDEADGLMSSEHPNGTRSVAPIVDLGLGSGIEAASFSFDSYGVAIA